MSRRDLVVCGYYGFGNLGDEAVLGGLVRGLRQAGYPERVIAMSASPPHTEQEHGVAAVSRTHLPALWRMWRRGRLFVLGGGSLLQDTTSARSLVYYLGMHTLARRAGCPIAWIGQGIGPLRRRWARRWTALAARQAATVVVRDPQSATLLRQLGVPRVIEAADLSFLLPEADTAEGWRILRRFGVHESESVVALAPRPWATGTISVVKLFQQIAREVQKSWGARMLLLPMHLSQDRELVEEIAEGLPGAVALCERLRVREAQAVLACCRLVVGMRLHALMLSAAAAVPALALSYDPKVRAFWEQVEPAHVIDLPVADVSAIQTYLRHLWEQYPVLRERVQAFAEHQRQLAQRNIEALRPLVS